MTNRTPNEVWILIDSRQFGGIETYVAQLAAGLIAHQQSTRVLLITEYTPASPLCAKLDALGVNYQYLGGSTFDALNQLCHLVNAKKPLALHANGYKANLIAKLAKLRTGIKLVSTYHAGEVSRGKMWLYDWLDRVSALIANHAIVVSHTIGKKVPRQTIYIENFIDTQAVEFSKGDQIAFVGRLSHEKAPERFLALAKKFPQLDFHLYGTGELEKALLSTTSHNCTLHGHQNDMSQVWPKISLLVICSHYEGLPMVALEAMARGIVVISTAVGELPQLLQTGSNGYLAHNEKELRQCLNHWLSLSNSQQVTLRQNAIKTIEQSYSQQAVIPKMLKLYSV